MRHRRTIALPLATVLMLAGAAALAQPPDHREEPHRQEPHREAHPAPAPHPQGEPHPGPRSYERAQEPQGWNNRPHEVDRGHYQHNFQAARSYHVGPYRRPPGWHEHHWVYGEILPRAYWAPDYLIADYWLFALEVPPAGYEWVRDGNDALMINVGDGTILQVEYGVFG